MHFPPWVAIQRNPMSGSGLRRPLLDLIRALQRHGLNPRLFSDRVRLDTALAEPGRREALHALVAAGGDGTVLDVINRHPGLPIGIFPLGTENLLARQFGIPRDGGTAADIIAAGHTIPLDLGRIGDRRFAIMVSVGFDAAVIHSAHAARTGHIRRSHYVWPIGMTLRLYDYPELRVYVDDAAQPVTGRMVVIANLASYALGLPMVPSARGDDGLLDVRIFHGGSTFHLLRYLYMVTTWSLDHLPDVTSLRAKSVRIESSVSAPVQADGDPAGTTPCVVMLEPAAARLFVPEKR
jgi:diacylglycerol kinase family enzyme